jgi:hypothetical protein
VRAALAALALLAQPAQAQRPCVTEPEAEAFALVAMPEIIRETGKLCAAQLPATSLVRRPSSPMLTRYDQAAERAWPQARAAMTKVPVPGLDALLESAYARPLLTTLLVPLLVGRLDTADCGTVDRIVADLEPLPPRNAAGLVVTILSHLKAERARGKRVDVPDLPLCPAERAR